MVHQSRIDYLHSLRNEIAAMSIVKCRMAHERVVGLTDSKQPAFSPDTPGILKRVGLCRPEVRAERPGCGHTMSRMKLDRAIGELEPGIAEPLVEELNWLTNEIHLLDHRKGEAEAQQAWAEQEAKRGREEAGRLELMKRSEIVKELERQHDKHVERMRVLWIRVISELDKVIAGVHPERGKSGPGGIERSNNRFDRSTASELPMVPSVIRAAPGQAKR